MDKWRISTSSRVLDDCFVLDPNKLSLACASTDSPPYSIDDSVSIVHASELKVSITSSSAAKTLSSSLKPLLLLSSHRQDAKTVKSSALWLELSCLKHTLDDLLNTLVRSSFTIVESKVPINDNGAIFIRRIVTKIAEEDSEDPEA